jgi:transcriptional regulator with XRE-family HTH domain
MDARGLVLTKLGQNVRALREGRRISQESLALEANLDRTYISQVERGRRNVSVVNLCRLAYVLRVSPSALIQDIAWPGELDEGEGSDLDADT